MGMTREEIEDIIARRSAESLLRVIAELLRGGGGGLSVATPSGVLAVQWHGVVTGDPGTVIAEAPAGYKIILTAFDLAADAENATVWLDTTDGYQFCAKSQTVHWRGHLEIINRPLRLVANTDWPVGARYHYEKIQPGDGLLALWHDGQLVDDVFGRTYDGNFICNVGQYDEMLRGESVPSFTFAAVVSVPVAGMGGDLYSLYKNGDEQLFLGYNLTIGSGYVWSFAYNAASVALPAPTPGVPYLVAMTYNGSKIRTYCDGVLFEESVVGPSGQSPSAEAFTRYDSSGAIFGACAMWNRALSATEIAALGTGAAPNFPRV